MSTKTEGGVGRPVMGVFLAAAALLSVPLLAMQVTDEVVWTLSDFVVAGVLMTGTGLGYVLATRAAGSSVYRWAVAVALGTTLLLVWVNLAVGVIGSEDDPANLMYGGVLAVVVLGAMAARLRPRAMAWTMAAAAAAQAVVAGIALVAGLGAPVNGPVEIVASNGLFVVLWMLAAGLFRAAGREVG